MGKDLSAGGVAVESGGLVAAVGCGVVKEDVEGDLVRAEDVVAVAQGLENHGTAAALAAQGRVQDDEAQVDGVGLRAQGSAW